MNDTHLPRNVGAVALVPLLVLGLYASGSLRRPAPVAPGKGNTVNEKDKSAGQVVQTDKDKTAGQVLKTDEEWRRELTPEQYRVLRQADTEAPFTGKYWNAHEDGTYTCAACGAVLFRSTQKFDSGCGWPSFYDAIDKGRIIERSDNSYGMHRTEVLCARCGSHLGHLFNDGPAPTGMRYCINSASLGFEKKTTP